MTFRILIFALYAVLMSTVTATSSAADTNEQIVQSYVAAFNAHDTEAMLKMVTEDVQWLSVDGQTIAAETKNKEELRSAMNSYFKSCSSCKSRLEHLFSTGSRVSALEVATYENSTGSHQQQSLSVYEFSGSLIRRVYYFPVEK